MFLLQDKLEARQILGTRILNLLQRGEHDLFPLARRRDAADTSRPLALERIVGHPCPWRR